MVAGGLEKEKEKFGVSLAFLAAHCLGKIRHLVGGRDGLVLLVREES